MEPEDSMPGPPLLPGTCCSQGHVHSQSVDTSGCCMLSVARGWPLSTTSGNAIPGAMVRAGGQGVMCSMRLGHCDDVRNFPKVHNENASSQKVSLGQHRVQGTVLGATHTGHSCPSSRISSSNSKALFWHLPTLDHSILTKIL